MKSGVQKAGKESLDATDCTSTSSKSGLTQMRLEISANTIGLRRPTENVCMSALE